MIQSRGQGLINITASSAERNDSCKKSDGSDFFNTLSQKRTFAHSCACIRVVSLGDLLNENDGILNCYDLLSSVVGNLAVELVLEGHG